jgi:diguanylate cyclase (GGDEF)-like protein
MALTIRNLKIRNQIYLMTFPLLLVLLCAVGLVFVAYQSVVSTNRAAQQSKERMARIQSFSGHVSQVFNCVQRYAVAHQANAVIPYDNIVADGLADLNALEEAEAADPGKLQEVARMRADFDGFRAFWAQPTIEMARAEGNYNATAAMADGKQRMNAIGMETSKLRKEEEARNTNEMQGAEQMMWQMLMVDGCLAALLIGVLIFVNGAWRRLIVAPVLQLIRAAEQVGRGDFAPDLPPVAENEIGILSRSFARMTTALRRGREEMAALNLFSEAVTQCTSEPEVYDLVLHSLKERFQPRQIIVFKMHSPENILEAVATLVPLAKEAGARPVIEDPQTCKAVRSGRAFVVNDVRVQALCPSKFALPMEGSYFCGPLIAGGVIIGSVRMEAAPDIWTPDRQRLLESYLSGAATALSNLRMRDTMKAQANFDMLTGLYNRRFAQEYARKQFAIAKRSGQPLGVAMLDLDHFKELNDAHGHDAGDSVLRHFAKTVTESIRETNLIARYGGEEFLVVLPETSTKSCVLVAQRIREAVMTMTVPSSTEKPIPAVTVSIGVAVFPEHGGTLQEVMQASDKALYESKRRGRNCVTVAPALDSAAA